MLKPRSGFDTGMAIMDYRELQECLQTQLITNKGLCSHNQGFYVSAARIHDGQL
jgi:hypothetical protein